MSESVHSKTLTGSVVLHFSRRVIISRRGFSLKEMRSGERRTSDWEEEEEEDEEGTGKGGGGTSWTQGEHVIGNISRKDSLRGFIGHQIHHGI